MRAAIFLGLAACAVPAKHAPDADVEVDVDAAAPDAELPTVAVDARICGPFVLTGGAQGLFHFDEESGQTAINAVDEDDALLGNDSNTETSDPERMSPARFESGLRFTAAEGDQVSWGTEVGDFGDHLVEVWVRPGAGGGSLFASVTGTISLTLAPDPLRLVYTLVDRGGDGSASVTSPQIAIGEWHHILASYKKPTLRVWIDGVLAPTATLDAGFRADSLTIGAGYDGELDELYFAQSAIDEDAEALARYCPP